MTSVSAHPPTRASTARSANKASTRRRLTQDSLDTMVSTRCAIQWTSQMRMSAMALAASTSTLAHATVRNSMQATTASSVPTLNLSTLIAQVKCSLRTWMTQLSLRKIRGVNRRFTMQAITWRTRQAVPSSSSAHTLTSLTT